MDSPPIICEAVLYWGELPRKDADQVIGTGEVSRCKCGKPQAPPSPAIRPGRKRLWAGPGCLDRRAQLVRNRSSISTWYPLARRFVSFAIPVTAINSANIASVIPALRA